MRRLLLISILFLSFSCCPKRALQSTQTDSVYIVREVEYIERLRDTTIYIEIPIEVKEAVVFRDSSYLNTALAESFARINTDGSLYHFLQNKPQEIPVDITVKDTEKSEINEEKEVQIRIIEVPVKESLRWYEKILIYSGLAGWLLLVFWLVRKFIK